MHATRMMKNSYMKKVNLHFKNLLGLEKKIFCQTKSVAYFT